MILSLLGMLLAIQAGNCWALEKIPVAASILPLGDFCRNLGGERVEVQVLIPPGASPHVFEPTPAVVARAVSARLLVYVGAGLDPWASKLLKAHPVQDRVVVEAVHGIPLINDPTSHHDHQSPALNYQDRGRTVSGSHHHQHPQGNPHVWLDPVLAQEICRNISAALLRVDPNHRQTYEDNLNHYLKALEDLHQEMQTRLAALGLREYVSFHPAFTYLARRYGLREVGVIEASPGREPTPRQIQRILSAIRRYHVKVVFAEPQFSPRVAEVIAREAGVRVLLLDPLGGRPPYGSDYLQMMRHNLAILTQAMQ